MSGASLLAALTVLGAAPAPLARLVERVFTGPKGLTVAMRNGLLVYFGDATRPHAKWLSLARVLADPSSAGASYVDVRLPVASGRRLPRGSDLPPAASTSAGAGASEQRGSPESTVAALAAGLSTAAPRAPATPALDGTGSRRSVPDAPPLRNRAASAAPAKRPRGAKPKRAQTGADARRLTTLNLNSRLMPSTAILRQWSRVWRSATIVARLDDIVDRAKFPA